MELLNPSVHNFLNDVMYDSNLMGEVVLFPVRPLKL